MTFEIREGGLADLSTLTELQARYDRQWLGAPERSEAEMAEELERASAIVVVLDEGEPVAAGWTGGSQTAIIIDPAVPTAAGVAALAPWLRDHPGTLEVLSRDDERREALNGFGWSHHHSAFELLRPVEPGWALEPPAWPAGIRVTDISGADLTVVHDLIYRLAGWAEVVGHANRRFDEWRSIFVTDRDPADQQVLAWRGDALVGAALGRIFDDGGGWVAQLAVATSERRNGLGRALLLEALHRRVAAGASSLGLGVQAENDGALALYLGVGLRIEREWQMFAPPT